MNHIGFCNQQGLTSWESPLPPLANSWGEGLLQPWRCLPGLKEVTDSKISPKPLCGTQDSRALSTGTTPHNSIDKSAHVLRPVLGSKSQHTLIIGIYLHWAGFVLLGLVKVLPTTRHPCNFQNTVFAIKSILRANDPFRSFICTTCDCTFRCQTCFEVNRKFSSFDRNSVLGSKLSQTLIWNVAFVLMALKRLPQVKHF